LPLRLHYGLAMAASIGSLWRKLNSGQQVLPVVERERGPVIADSRTRA
jgi:hypothetical protein